MVRDIVGIAQHGIEQILMVLQAYAGPGPSILPTFPRAQSNPITILQRQPQH